MRAYQYSCPGCGTTVPVLDRNLGGMFSCYQCGKTSHIPENLSPISANVQETTGPMGERAWNVNAEQAKITQRRPAARRPARRSKKMPGWAITCIAISTIVLLVGFFGVVVAAYWHLAENQTSSPPNEEAPDKLARGKEASPENRHSLDNNAAPAKKRTPIDQWPAPNFQPPANHFNPAVEMAPSNYPITIPIPDDAVRVDKKTRLRAGMKLQACWANRWHDVEVVQVLDDGSPLIHWKDWDSGFDSPMFREDLIIRKRDR